MPSFISRLVGVAVLCLGFLLAACPAHAQVICESGTDDYICSDLPSGICPEGYHYVQHYCGENCCEYCTTLNNPGCIGTFPGGIDCLSINGTTIVAPYYYLTCGVELPACWVYTCVDDPQPEYPNGCLIQFDAIMVDSCDPEEGVDWTICQGSSLVTVVSMTDLTLTVRVKGSGPLTVVAKQSPAPGGPFDREKKIIVGSVCLGDINHDSTVDGADLGILLSDYGSPGCGGASTCCESDLNGDGDVDGADLGLLLAAYGACP